MNDLPAKAAFGDFSEDEISNDLAGAARSEFPKGEIEEILRKASAPPERHAAE
jgi:hypothetical protein